MPRSQSSLPKQGGLGWVSCLGRLLTLHRNILLSCKLHHTVKFFYLLQLFNNTIHDTTSYTSRNVSSYTYQNIYSKIIWPFGIMFVFLPSQPIKREFMEQQLEINNRQRSFFRGHPQMKGENPVHIISYIIFNKKVFDYTMKILYSTIMMLAMMFSALFFASCGNGEDEYAIEDALQKEWDISNSSSAVGAVESNVFSVKVDKVEGNTVYVSYSLKSKYASGDKKFVKLKEAKLTKDVKGNYKVESTGY